MNLSTTYPQTILQLYNLVRNRGYSQKDLLFVRTTYEFAAKMFSCRYTSSGRSFIAHVVGTAGILASLKLPAEVVAAGLVHNVYGNGDFGFGTGKLTRTKRRFIKTSVGQQVEKYAFGFVQLRWNSSTIPSLLDSLDTVDEVQRHIILIRLADILDHYLDQGFVQGETEQQNGFILQSGPRMVEMAARLGYPSLAHDLEHALHSTLHQKTAPDFHNVLKHTGAFVMIPPSLRKRFFLSLYQNIGEYLHLWRIRILGAPSYLTDSS